MSFGGEIGKLGLVFNVNGNVHYNGRILCVKDGRHRYLAARIDEGATALQYRSWVPAAVRTLASLLSSPGLDLARALQYEALKTRLEEIMEMYPDKVK